MKRNSNIQFLPMSIQKRWLKKYTELRFVENTLKHRFLHLGAPHSWDDKNDSEVMRIYSQARKSDFPILATCMTQAPDRFHFWHIFGKRELGACLWFSRESLIDDIKTDKSLISGAVRYPKNCEIPNTKLNEIPFTKRKQYIDEQEFRVIRVAQPRNTPREKFAFSPDSLKRVYLNPWLSNAEVDEEKRKLNRLTVSEFRHVEVKQNRSLSYNVWINKLSRAAEKNG